MWKSAPEVAMFRSRNLILAVIAIVAGGLTSVNAQQQQLQLLSLSPADLMYSEIEGGFVPAEFEVSCWVVNRYDTLLTDIRLELFCDDFTHLSSLEPQSFVFTIDTLQSISQGGRTFQADWTLRYSSTVKRLDSLVFWFRLSYVDPYSGLPVDTLAPTTTTMLVDWFKPHLSLLPGKNFYVPHLGKVTCSGYDPPVVPATLYAQNTNKYRIPVDSLKIQIPDGWTFAHGYAASVPIHDTLAYLDSIRYTWALIPPIHPIMWEHEFKVTVVYSGSHVQTIPTIMRTIGINEQLRLTTTLPKLHIIHDAQSGYYSNLPLDISATLTAWGGDFETATVSAELVYGTWMFLELDGSQPGMEIVKQTGPLAMCDSVELRWKANMIKPNEFGTPYEGAIKYTVSNPDSSIFKEYIQPLIIDAVNQTGTSHLPAAEELQLSAYPNPVHGTTTLRYTLPVRGYVSLRVYDIMGRLAARLHEGLQEPGTHPAMFITDDLPPGMYTVTISDGESSKSIHILRL